MMSVNWESGLLSFHHGIIFPDGPPLPVGEQLRGLHELQVLHPLPALRPPLLRLLRALLAQVLPRVLVIHRAQGEQRQWKVGSTIHLLNIVYNCEKLTPKIVVPCLFDLFSS